MRWVSLFILILATLLYADPPWITNIRVSTDVPWDDLNQGESCFAVWGDTIVSICNTAERAIVPIAPYAYSFDEGQTFTQIPFTDNTTGITWHTDPVIAVDDSGHVHMLIQFSVNLLKHYLSRDGGLTWSDTTIVTPYYGVDKPWMVVNNNEIYIVWQQVAGEYGIWLAKSTDYGASFNTYRIWHRTYITALCMDENENLHLALVNWESDSVYYRKSIDKGETWLPEVALSNWYYQTSYGDRAPINSITARGDVVFVTWVDTRYGGWDIMGVRSTDGGTNWDSRFIVNDITNGGQCKGWAHFDDYGGLHVTYYHTPDWPTNINSLFSFHYQYSSDSGATFHPSIRVSDTSFTSLANFMGEYHICVSDSQFLYTIWTDGRNGDDNDLYFSKALLSELSGDVPLVSIYNYGWTDSGGDEHADPGDTVSLTIALLNSGQDASSVEVNLSLDDTFITLIDSSSYYGEILNDSIKDNSNDPFIIWIHEDAPLYTCSLNVDISADNFSSFDTIFIKIGTPLVLVVDNDGEDSYETYFTQSLDRLGVWFDLLDSKEGITNSFISDYDAVIWLTGDNASPVDSADVLAISYYLDSGGNLFISGQDVEGCADTSFYHNYLHATLIEDSTHPFFVDGVEDDSVGNNLSFMIIGSTGANNQDTPSTISPNGGADSVFNHRLGGCCGVKYENEYKVLYISFGFEAINSFLTADTVMTRVLQWFDLPVGIEERYMQSEPVSINLKTRPNPFRDNTVISYQLFVNGNDASRLTPYALRIFDVSGRPVRTIPLPPFPFTHRSSVVWDGKDDSGKKVPSGVYFLKFDAGEYTLTTKLLKVR